MYALYAARFSPSPTFSSGEKAREDETGCAGSDISTIPHHRSRTPPTSCNAHAFFVRLTRQVGHSSSTRWTRASRTAARLSLDRFDYFPHNFLTPGKLLLDRSEKHRHNTACDPHAAPRRHDVCVRVCVRILSGRLSIMQ